MKITHIALSFFALLLLVNHSAYGQDSLAGDVLGNLASMKAAYRAEYAPAEWKKKFSGYDLNAEYAKATAAVIGNPNLTMTDAKNVLKQFIYAMRDYHVSIQFVSTEQASLPFVVRGVGDRFFIVYIDREKMSEKVFPFKVGDELVGIDGQPVLKVVQELQGQFTENVPTTDRTIAEGRLTKRQGSRGVIGIPSGPVTLEIKPMGSSESYTYQTIWDYTAEEVSPRGILQGLDATSYSYLFRPRMAVDLADVSAAGNPYDNGARKTFTPDLGKKTWESDEKSIFYAYTYENEAGKKIGYIRIPSYVPEVADTTQEEAFNKAVAEFETVIGQFEKTTDAMVIDQVNNPGGSVFYLYALAARLTDQPLRTPLHRMSITQTEVSDALNVIERLKKVKTDEDAKKALKPDDLEGYTPSFQFAKFTIDYAKFIVSEWRAGRKLTNPYWIGGVNYINPSPVHYTKPILLLVNQMDFSGGDFFPAILQDNKRVAVMGTRTAGAGGYVNDVTFPNNVGILKYRITESIASRADGNPIENLGVKPDIDYSMTVEDYTTNYAPYVKAVNNAVGNLRRK